MKGSESSLIGPGVQAAGAATSSAESMCEKRAQKCADGLERAADMAPAGGAAGSDGDRAHADGGGGVRPAAVSGPMAVHERAELCRCAECRRYLGRRRFAAERRVTDEGIADEERRDQEARDKEKRYLKARFNKVPKVEGTPKGKGKGYGQPKDPYVRVQEVQKEDEESQACPASPPEQEYGGKGDSICSVTGESASLPREDGIKANGSRGAWILVDSGAACHVCPRGWMSQADTCLQAGRDLRTATGERMQHYGRRTVNMKFGGSDEHGAATFEVTDVKYPILAVGELLKTGHVFVFSPTNPYLVRPTGEKIALEMRNGLPYVKVEVLDKKKKQQSPRLPRKKVIDEASSEPPTGAQLPTIREVDEASSEPPAGAQMLTIKEINEGYERELKSDAEAYGWITTEGYQQDLTSDAEPTIHEIDKDYKQEHEDDVGRQVPLVDWGDEARGGDLQSFPCAPRHAPHAVYEGKGAGLCAADGAEHRGSLSAAAWSAHLPKAESWFAYGARRPLRSSTAYVRCLASRRLTRSG